MIEFDKNNIYKNYRLIFYYHFEEIFIIIKMNFIQNFGV